MTLARDESYIGLSTKKSIHLIAQILGILKSGKAYLPLDPEYPVQRQQYMIENSNLKFILDDGSFGRHWETLGLKLIGSLNVERSNTQIKTENDATAAILFTSGSTGNPKGVQLGHLGLCQNIEFQSTYPCLGPKVKTIQYAHLAFDGAILEIFNTLWTGGELHLMEEIQRLDNFQLLKYIENNKINRVFLPKVILNSLIEDALSAGLELDSLTEITTAGELLKITPSIRCFFSKAKNAYLKNAYGPTEASVCVTEFVLDSDPQEWPDIPSIGTPVTGSEIWVLDEMLNQVQDGQIGELYISGSSLAIGYLNRPDLTEERFIYWFSPNSEIIRLYKTGDLVLKDSQGLFHFKGRGDDQIKIRGNRVELGEIELALGNLEGIKQAVVKLAIDDFGQKFLSAYLNTDTMVDLGCVKKQLKKILPDYMIPEIFMVLKEFPKTSSGKVDKLALPKPKQIRPDWMDASIQAANDLEADLIVIFKGTLIIDDFGTIDNFFEFGGNSIKAQQVLFQLRNLFGIEIPIAKLYQFPTVRGLSNYISKAGSSQKSQSNKEVPILRNKKILIYK